MQPKVSVIVPVYNVEPYLRRCLDSLVNQTLKDIEIICINDYSPDNSLIILKEYAEKDNRVKIINFEKNQGVSIARNAGIELAKGEYIGICDPDDYVDLNFYDKLYNKAKETEADMVKTGFKEKHIDWTKEYSRYASIKQNKYHDTFFHWCYIYKTDMLKRNQIRYPEDIRLSEDAFFLIKSLFYSKKIVIVHDVFYHYIRRECNAATSCFGEAIANSYGIPLIFDFMNKAVKDKNEYIDFFSAFFGKVLHLFTLAIPEYRKYVVRAAIDIYKNRQYSITLENLPEFLKENDFENADVLFEKLNDSLILLKYPEIKINNLQNRKLYIWGAGRNGLDALIQCDNNGWTVEAFLDSNKNVKKYNEYKVERPEQILNKPKEDFFIIISSRKYGKEIAGICRKAGLKRGKDFWSSK